MYAGPPPPKRDDPDATRARTPAAEPAPAGEFATERPTPVRADETPANVQTGRAVFCAALLVWAVVGLPAYFRHREQGDVLAATAAATAAALKVGLGLLVGGGSLLRLLTTKTPDRPARPAGPANPPRPDPGGE